MISHFFLNSIHKIVQNLRKIKRMGYLALFARNTANLNAVCLFLADLVAITSALFALLTLSAAFFSSLLLLFATSNARLAALPPELFPLDLRLDFPADLRFDLPPAFRLDFPADLFLDLPEDLREPLLLEAIISPSNE